MPKGIAAHAATGLTVGIVAMLAHGEASAQAPAGRDEVRAALAAQIWGEGPGVMLGASPEGGVRLLYQSSSGQAALGYRPSDRTFHALTSEPPATGPGRRHAKLGYALTEQVEVFVDLQKRQKSQAEAAMGRDWLPETARRPRTYAVGVSARW